MRPPKITCRASGGMRHKVHRSEMADARRPKAPVRLFVECLVPVIPRSCHPSGMKRTSIFVTIVVSLFLAACGESGILDGVGERTRELVEGTTTTSIATVVVETDPADEGLAGPEDLLWFNDDIDPQFTGGATEVIGAVWGRKVNSRFVQASRAEIAAAMPSVLFPELLPKDVQWVTSQLVYDNTTGALDPDTAAAFGFWISEPYQSDTARLGVLRIGFAPIDVGTARSDIVPILVPDGISLGWTESGYRYELFCRSSVSDQLCTEVATSSVPLHELDT